MLKRRKRIVITLVLMFILTFTSLSMVGAEGTSTDNSVRFGGRDRYETALQISKNGWQKSDYAIISNGEDFPDALGATPLAKKYKAPILLTNKYSVGDDVDSELTRLGVKEVFLLGGTGVISNDIVNQLNAKGIVVTRLAGQDRYETSVKIAEKLGQRDSIVVTTGENFADALSIAPIAAAKDIPILLVSKDQASDAVKQYISKNSIYNTYVVGNSDEVSDNVFSQFPNSERISGSDKYETNKTVINRFADNLDFNNVCIASGNDFPDSLSGSAYAAQNNSPVLLVNDNNYSNLLDTSLSSNVKSVTVFGGTGSVSESIENYIIDAFKSTLVTPTKSIKGIKDIVINVDASNNFKLPSTVEATLEDNTTASVNVTWDRLANIIKGPKQVYYGVVNGYSKQVKLTVNCTNYTGNATFDNENGTYSGYVRNGLREFNGTFTWKNGDKYDGSWSEDKMDGYGTLNYANGNSYTGSFSSNKRSGNGTFKWDNGDIYTGSWSNDKMNGYGTYKFSNGTTLRGQWKDNIFIK